MEQTENTVKSLKAQGFTTTEAVAELHRLEQLQFEEDAMRREEEYYSDLAEDHEGRI